MSRGTGGVGSPLRWAERIRRPSWRDGMGQKGRERSGIPPSEMGRVGIPPRRAGRIGRLTGETGGVGRDGRGQENLLERREW